MMDKNPVVGYIVTSLGYRFGPYQVYTDEDEDEEEDEE